MNNFLALTIRCGDSNPVISVIKYGDDPVSVFYIGIFILSVFII